MKDCVFCFSIPTSACIMLQCTKVEKSHHNCR